MRRAFMQCVCVLLSIQAVNEQSKREREKQRKEEE